MRQVLTSVIKLITYKQELLKKKIENMAWAERYIYGKKKY